MIINMGPQHPSHPRRAAADARAPGRDGAALQADHRLPAHRHGEDRRERSRYMQGGTNVTRMDYASPLINELVFSMATEKLLGIDGDIPERATWIRMLMGELNRMAQPPAVPGDQRHGPRRGLDDDLRLARARRGAALLPEGHRAADEPQLHPARRRRRRPARRLARRRAPDPRHRRRHGSTSTTR